MCAADSLHSTVVCNQVYTLHKIMIDLMSISTMVYSRVSTMECLQPNPYSRLRLRQVESLQSGAQNEYSSDKFQKLSLCSLHCSVYSRVSTMDCLQPSPLKKCTPKPKVWLQAYIIKMVCFLFVVISHLRLFRIWIKYLKIYFIFFFLLNFLINKSFSAKKKGAHGLLYIILYIIFYSLTKVNNINE